MSEIQRIVAQKSQVAVAMLLIVSAAPLLGGDTFSTRMFPTGIRPGEILSQDINRDGWQDLIVVNQISNNVVALLGEEGGSLSAPQELAQYFCPRGIAITDTDSDGEPDLIVSGLTDWVGVYAGLGDGVFDEGMFYYVGEIQRTLAVSDFNEDGSPDLLFGLDNELTLLFGSATGEFSPPTILPPPGSRLLAVGDYDGDHNQDIAAGRGASVALLFGNGDGTFAATGAVSLPATAMDVVAHDFNEDGRTDLAVTNTEVEGISVLIADTNRRFMQPVEIPAQVDRPTSLQLGDLNHDGQDDLVLGSINDDRVAVFLGQQDGSFEASATYHTAHLGGAMSIGLYGHDGHPDVAISSYWHVSDLVPSKAATFTPGGVTVLRGDGAGSLSTQVAAEFVVGEDPTRLAIDDLDLDGHPDVVTTNERSLDVTTLLGDGVGGFTSGGTTALGVRASAVTLANIDPINGIRSTH